MSAPFQMYGTKVIRGILSQRKPAWMIDGVTLPCSAIKEGPVANGYFRVPDDEQVIDGFGTLTNAALSEFVRQVIEVYSLKHDEARVYHQVYSRVELDRPAFPGDELRCAVFGDQRINPGYYFSALIHRVNGKHPDDSIAVVALGFEAYSEHDIEKYFRNQKIKRK